MFTGVSDIAENSRTELAAFSPDQTIFIGVCEDSENFCTENNSSFEDQRIWILKQTELAFQALCHLKDDFDALWIRVENRDPDIYPTSYRISVCNESDPYI